MSSVDFYYQLGSLSTFKQNTKPLKDIVQRDLRAMFPYQHVTTETYYKPKKLDS